MRRLLIRPGAIGDCVLCLPALECLKAAYTEVWVPSNIVPLIRFADCARPIARTGLDLLGIPGLDAPAGLLERLRGFDSVVSWYGANRGDFRDAVAARGLPFRFLDALPPDGVRLHAADFFLGQAGSHGAAIPQLDCPLGPPREFAAIQPFSGGWRKNWPLEKFRELARRLPFGVEWCAGPAEQLAGAARFEDLYELACWLATARVYIGNDSGITHLAAAAGCPVVAIFGVTDAAVWGPRGPRVRIVDGDLPAISVEQVLTAVHDVLKAPRTNQLY